MECRQACQTDIELLAKYNERMFPERGAFAAKYVDFLFSKTADEYTNSVVIDNNGVIKGQLLAYSMQYAYDGDIYNSVWAYDLIVDEELRKDAYGLDLMMFHNRIHKTSFCTGSGPTALKIELALGYKWMGEIRKYVGVCSLLRLITSVCRGVISMSKFPEQIVVDNETFIRCNPNDVEWSSVSFNEKLWEPLRDNDYMRWRFSNKLHEYAVYKACNSSNYFVLRTIVKRGITALVLVDFRCNMQCEEEIELMLRAVKKIMRKMWLAILICGSSHLMLDKKLESFHMYSVGRPRPFIGRISYKERKEDIKNRQFALVTLADSDGETLW